MYPEPRESPADLAVRAAAVIAERSGVARFDVALVLGSGWGGAADLIGETIAVIPAEEVPGFQPSPIPGHSANLRAVRLSGDGPKPAHALILGARAHYYEHRDVRAVAHPIRVAAASGVRALVLTNGCGSVRPDWGPGTVVLIRDHINLTAASPLEGAAFVDLTDAYSPRLRALARSVQPDLPEGVYAQFPGPHYESPAEVAMARVLGADLVGMSTALETIAARAAGLEVLGLSLATNLAAGVSAQALSHAEVLQAGSAAGPRISALLARIIPLVAEPADPAGEGGHR
ncbi:MAG: purine-nucleoside phosphorylase [Bifidobacteriaceae bacterium]|nr:purine-nucleoside phosphorylase [Bifidobacteriaceae bacterium]